MISELKKEIESKIEALRNKVNIALKESRNKFKILVHKKANLPIEYTIEVIVAKHSEEDDYGVLLDVLGQNKTEENFEIEFDLYRANGPILKSTTITTDSFLKDQTLSNILSELEKELIEVLKTQYLN